jgi:Uma2 family endonuclease
MKAAEPVPSSVRGARIWPLSVAAYRALGEMGFLPKNTELLYGQVYQKMPKSPFHSALVRRLVKLLQGIPLAGRFVMSEQPITGADSEPEPDVAIVRGAEEDYWNEHPRTAELVIEICVTSHEYDRFKLQAYAAAGVPEVWLVLAPEKQVQVFRQPADGQFTEAKIHGPGGRLTCVAVPEFTLDLDPLFVKGS